MRKPVGIVALCLALAACGSTSEEVAREPAAAPAQADPDAVMAAYAKANAMNANHRRLAQFVGEWDVAATDWTIPGKPPRKTTGTATFEKVLGGRYVRQDYSAGFLGFGYYGLGITGYDNAKQTYVDFWFDNMRGSALVSEGNWDASGTTFTAVGRRENPVTGETETFENVIVKQSDDRFVFTTYAPAPGGGSAKSLELTYTRKQ